MPLWGGAPVRGGRRAVRVARVIEAVSVLSRCTSLLNFNRNFGRF